jgi:hypothetical protein
MKGLATTLWSRLLAGVFLTLLAREALAPAGACASSCGDYVTVTNPSPPSLPSPHEWGRVGWGVAPVPHDPPAPGKAPCHTPSCEGGPAMPTPPVSSAGSPAQERWDGLLPVPPFHATAAFALPLVARAAKPRRLPSSIFHPPRPC